MALEPGMDTETARWWLDTSAQMVGEAKHLGGVRERQATAENRALWVAGLGLLVLFAVAVWGLQRGGPTQNSERAHV